MATRIVIFLGSWERVEIELRADKSRTRDFTVSAPFAQMRPGVPASGLPHSGQAPILPVMKKIVIASNNAGKLREFGALLTPFDFVAIPQAQLGIPEGAEPFATFVENALAKARHAARSSGLPALADDSGICVPSLDGAPGVRSARFAGEPRSDARNNQRLIAALENADDRSAFYYCALVLLQMPLLPFQFARGQGRHPGKSLYRLPDLGSRSQPAENLGTPCVFDFLRRRHAQPVFGRGYRRHSHGGAGARAAGYRSRDHARGQSPHL